MADKHISAISAEVFGQEVAEAEAAGARGYMGRVFVQTTMPHKRTSDIYVEHQNGTLTVRMTATTPIGLPYGTPPRHVLAWVTTEAVRTQSRHLVLGDSYGAWLTALGVNRGGDDYRRYQRATAALFGTAIAAVDVPANGSRMTGSAALFAERFELWWDAKSPDQLGLWESTVSISQSLYDTIVDRPVPVDLRALRILGRSPLALDLYTWLTYRMSYLRNDALIPWSSLHAQFGSEYARTRAFREHARSALLKVAQVYPAARVEVEVEGLRLRPSPPHISRRRVIPGK